MQQHSGSAESYEAGKPSIRLHDWQQDAVDSEDQANHGGPVRGPVLPSLIVIASFLSYGQPAGFALAILTLLGSLFGLLGHPAGNFRPLRVAVLAIVAGGLAWSLVFVFLEASVGRGLLCLAATAVALVILKAWWDQLRASDLDTTRLFAYVLGVILGLLALYADLASIAS